MFDSRSSYRSLSIVGFGDATFSSQRREQGQRPARSAVTLPPVHTQYQPCAALSRLTGSHADAAPLVLFCAFRQSIEVVCRARSLTTAGRFATLVQVSIEATSCRCLHHGAARLLCTHALADASPKLVSSMLVPLKRCHVVSALCAVPLSRCRVSYSPRQGAR